MKNNGRQTIINLENEMAEFVEAKNKYANCRGKQLKIIMNYLEQEAGFTVSPPGGGHGCKNYGGGGKKPRFSKAYDLSDWRYVDCEKEGKRFCFLCRPMTLTLTVKTIMS